MIKNAAQMAGHFLMVLTLLTTPHHAKADDPVPMGLGLSAIND